MLNKWGKVDIEKESQFLKKSRKIEIILIGAWTVLVVLLTTWDAYQISLGMYDEARVDARSFIRKDIIFRRWNAECGGVYVPISESIKPNPYLKVPERNIITPSGKKLTLINPVYMTRIIHKLFTEKYEIIGHITSLNPINPDNAPDKWETLALKKFEKGIKEVSEVVKIKGERYMRLMRPLIIEKPCLKCHAVHGYKEGDIRGGISVLVPIRHYWGMMRKFAIPLIITRFLIWVIGIFGITFALHKISKHLYQYIKIEEEKKRLEKQLIQAQRMEAIGRLAGGIAHDFNNLLAAIQGHAELAMVLSSDKDSLTFKNINQIQRACIKATNLIRQLLLFSRKQPMHFAPVNLNKIIAGLLKIVKRVIGENVIIETELPPDIMYINADEGNMEQVIMNLVVNAKDAMPEGGTIVIRTKNVTLDDNACKYRPEAYPGEFVCLEISDTGMGMDRDTLEHIFEPFFTTKEIGKGTGLGLSVVYGIVKEHKGWIEVQSEIGKGSIFKIYFPAISKLERTISEDKMFNAEFKSGKGETILIVEDNEDVLDILKEILTKSGYAVLEAKNIKEAYSIFKKEKVKIRLVISDVVLPDGSGVKLVEEMMTQSPNLKTILSSGYPSDEVDLAEINKKGFLFLQKPFILTELLMTIRKILD